MIPLFDITRQYKMIKDEVLKAIDRVLSSGRVILGPEVEKLESNIANLVGVKYGVGVANGSDALVIALRALGIKKGNKVITTSYTFFATASSIVRNNAIPIFVDVDKDTYNIDLNQVEDILKKEKIFGLIPVHLFGQTVDLEGLNFLKEKYGIKILEDCAQSIGSEGVVKGKIKKSGSIGDAAIFSFFPTKNLGAYGDGGLIVTNDKKVYEKSKMLRTHGAKKKYYHEEVGYNSRLDEIHAAILNIKLKYLDTWTENRINIAKKYAEEFKNRKMPLKYPYPKDKFHVFHQYVVEFEKEDDRNKVRTYLSEKGIGTSIYYPVPLHLQKCFKDFGYKKGNFPISEKLSKTTLALPIFPELRFDEVETIVSKIEEALRR
ncbi:Pleiotropic regulatory protein [Thermosipho melanesiensis]|uniref:DegT/DnrJ/EryC1/StrS aminotransferase n=2 Tax=Thermosipho melanesiensis TaxID=46541 RepID=A6LK55_THEM4|nr:DegT/DnrJ/EryC1/StrS family aminotransferase [Thermosipho melanesiensis]ABR30306.1 DegT/DnrJ/EryC1/StrS aminotransferase [Thermosipho melanesiensis BI429]APT73479.1 Pleiotropic regulatory protein [Thermosipho melanesiensis]OOC37428.1 Pleiotropic regulatory protein [Thermosipho melanesiensis]OOC39790.1 Pleiotropic regulatory protein [Thermosipho melanesiensis]OOC39895.1 Pleiotropic regulatory protein [Thermosipho melanesiensis]